MRALHLDYREDRRYLGVLGLLLLLMVVVLAGATAWYFNALRQEKIHLEALVDKFESRIQGNQSIVDRSRMDPAQLEEVIKFSNQVIHQLNRPWDSLFAQLEKARGDNIALLGIEPDMKSPVIHIVGEAKNYAAMLDYVRKLSETGALRGVYLVDHKMEEQNADHPIKFTLEALWAAK